MSTSEARRRIFITGGSGFVGSRIIFFAVAEGYEVRALSRSEKSDEKLQDLGAVPVRGDLSTLEVLTQEAAVADVVIHLADSQIGNLGMSWDEILRIDGAAVGALAEGLNGSGKRLLVTSGSLVAAADPTGAETDESSPPWPEDQAPHQRLKAEKHALGMVDKGITVATIRLAPCVHGHGGSGPVMFMKLATMRGQVCYVDEGNTRTSFVHVDDAARAYLLAAKKARAGDIFNVTAETNVTMRQLTEAFGEALRLPTKSLTREKAAEMVGQFLARFLTTENRASNAKAKGELGWQPREIGILEDITSGSYKAVAETLIKPQS
ncbi:putative nad dependent epimerase protein [Phaeoacremonium minimum UCRPA7]|uniref:Putative nad dependent epimerase protein n=1 Tax=Phaeoacremonium minimum (strain UCR-PA7) TaxID=1286976 RepID=R8BV82_PHAM7|nr:putative nad dependent epimerase protein [Phaeoacremonium minimum UCRPA7]EOO03230.1 putative nad dependent epimerase protein [Phaeoacremonium minimum UCRPA7]